MAEKKKKQKSTFQKQADISFSIKDDSGFQKGGNAVYQARDGNAKKEGQEHEQGRKKQRNQSEFLDVENKIASSKAAPDIATKSEENIISQDMGRNSQGKNLSKSHEKKVYQDTFGQNVQKLDIEPEKGETFDFVRNKNVFSEQTKSATKTRAKKRYQKTFGQNVQKSDAEPEKKETFDFIKNDNVFSEQDFTEQREKTEQKQSVSEDYHRRDTYRQQAKKGKYRRKRVKKEKQSKTQDSKRKEFGEFQTKDTTFTENADTEFFGSKKLQKKKIQAQKAGERTEKARAKLPKKKEYTLKIGGVKVDINPITEERTGTLATYLPGVESYLAEKREAMQMESAKEEAVEKKPTIVTLMVSECSEFHNLGEFHEGIETVDEAIKLYNQIPLERMSGVRGIGINIYTEGTERYEDVEMDIVSGKVADLEMLDYVPDITDDPKAIEMIAELIDKLPDIEVRGSLEKWQAASLATQIDQLSYDYDTYQYKDTVEDREAQVANITEDIRNGNTGYLNDFLNAVISEGVREGVTDIFGQGVEIDDSEAVQTVRRAKELLDKLAEYKPLAKIEELEEANYNMIDNVLNNEKSKKEEERSPGRISIKEKLAEKKAMIEYRDKGEKLSPDKDAEKKSHREI